MKRSIPKLVVHRETIRALVAMELARVVGGDTARETETCKVNCTLAVAASPPAGA
jgi:hypothetical protein